MLALVLAITIAAENQKAGTAGWDITRPALNREIEGYASRTSVNTGEPIDLFVSTTDARYAIDIYRMGWYGGAGARQVAGPIERDGVLQAVPNVDTGNGLVECRWRDPARVDTRDWTSGVYLARLTARPSGLQSFIVFVVRDDTADAAIVFQSSVTTFAAYNNWGGKSLYGFNSGNAPARKVSFDRPYAANPYGVRLDGAGDFLRRWEYNTVRFLEREGFDVTYITDVDTHARADLLRNRRVFLSVGHDEYWSWEMRRHVEAARDSGLHLAFLGAGACYWQIRFEPNASGDANRTIVGYKEAAGDRDPLAIDRDPQNDRYVTGRWRDRPASRPEERLIGVMYAADPVDADMVVSNGSHWMFEGTGLRDGDALPGLLGYEVDARYGGGPGSLETLAHSPFVDHGKTRYADMTIYTARSGAIVLATGSMQWTWGLDGYNAPGWHPVRVNAGVQQATRNALNRMLQTQPRTRDSSPSPFAGGGPSVIVLVAAALGAAWVLGAWITRRRSLTWHRQRPGR